ncbi:MAG: hypothetical protein ACPHWV_05625, partial [Candidatus Puniceispirillum sp.]
LDECILLADTVPMPTILCQSRISRLVHRNVIGMSALPSIYLLRVLIYKLTWIKGLLSFQRHATLSERDVKHGKRYAVPD